MRLELCKEWINRGRRGRPSVNQPTWRRVRRSYWRASSSSVLYFFAGHVGGRLSISARAENRSDDGGCIDRSLSRISLFFCLRDRPRSAHDHTPYRQQTLGSSCVPWLYSHRVLVNMGKVQAANLSNGTIVANFKSEDQRAGMMVSVAVSYPHGAHPHGMIVKRQVSAWQRPLS